MFTSFVACKIVVFIEKNQRIQFSFIKMKLRKNSCQKRMANIAGIAQNTDCDAVKQEEMERKIIL